MDEIAYFTKLYIRPSKSVLINNKPNYCSQSSFHDSLVCEFNQPIREREMVRINILIDVHKTKKKLLIYRELWN